MSRRNLFLLLAAIIFIGCDIAILTWYFTREPDYKEPPLTFDGRSDQLQHTIIVPTLDTPIPEGKNAIWCASFQIAWNKLKTDVAKGPVQIQGAEEIAKRLNDSPVTESDLPEGSYYAAAGLSSDGIEQTIRGEMQRRFPSWPTLHFPSNPNRVAVAYAYMEAEVAFERLFDNLDEPLVFKDSQGRATKLGGFGIIRQRVRDHKHRSLQDQVRILAAKLPDEFAVQLLGRSSTELILVALPRRGTFGEVLQDAETLFRLGRRRPVSETLAVPVLNWSVVHRYTELEGPDHPLANLPGLYLGMGYQLIRFKLDRSGASLKSEAKISVESKADDSSPIALDFNRPFLILLRQPGAKNPFFVMWVDNAELLQKWGE